MDITFVIYINCLYQWGSKNNLNPDKAIVRDYEYLFCIIGGL